MHSGAQNHVGKAYIKLLDSKAQVPERASPEEVGYDLFVLGIHKRLDSGVILLRTGIAIDPPVGYYFEIIPRSSISKTHVMQANSVGVIDPGYRGELLIPVRPFGSMKDMWGQAFPQPIKFGQLVLRKRLSCSFEAVPELMDSLRGEGGFGSTGD